ncbi:MAG TPA: PEP/pyruvate-binding domain-containing protein [Solirubrobacteraceae bacterium]|jgi:pyruvate,water dikinase|nr:PEP/pyruvate-binding domain-containing protein [Solirubrobacteraceae bacterium]
MSAAWALHTRGLEELRAQDADRFGGKSASLGELLEAGIPVPPGFAISTEAGEDMTDTLRNDVAARYERLGDEVAVAVRSSALGEDSAEATFAGQQDTYLWVRGIDAVCDAVTKCWASLYSTEAVSYRERFGVENPAMGVTIQLMVDAAVSGVMFTCNPVSGDRSMVAINASWGLGLAVVGGEVTPDDYLVSKITGEIVKQTINDKAVEYVPATEGTRRVDVDEDRRRQACLDADAIKTLVDVAKRVERHFGSPQDIEWAFDQPGELFVLQSRPVTGLAQQETQAAAPPSSAMSMIFNKFGAGG